MVLRKATRREATERLSLRHSFFFRLFCCALLLCLLIIAVTGGLLYALSTASVQSGLREQTLSGLQAISGGLDSLFHTCEVAARQLAGDDTVRGFLRGEAGATRYDAARMLYLSSVGISEGATVHILRVSDGEIVSTGEPSPLFTDGNYNAEYTLFKRMKEAEGVALYTTVKGIMMRPDTRVVMGCAVRDGEQTAGYVIVELSREAFLTAARAYSFLSNSPIAVVDEYDVVLFSTSGEEAEGLGRLSEAWKEALDALWSGPASGALEVDDLCFSRCENAPYAVVAGVSTQLLGAVRHSAAQAVLPVLLIACLTGIVFAFVVARTVSAPIRRMSEAMDEVEKGNFRALVPVTSSDELGRLSAKFNHMQRRIEALIKNIEEKQRSLRQAEMNALALQVNPHFLYNTLDLIKWSIRLGKTDEAAQIVVRLGKLLRRLLNEHGEVVPVGEEMDLVRAYLEIQRYRYADKLRIFFDIEEAILPLRIPKLVLQPLIENAIVHGLEGQLSGGELTVSGRREGAYLRFVVSDDGAGMSAETLERVRRMKPNGMYNIGLSNVNQRARLYGDERCGVEIESALGVGTTITLTLKVLAQGGNEGVPHGIDRG